MTQTASPPRAFVIEVYICPECGCYYGGSNMPKLEERWVGPKTENKFQHPRREGVPPGMSHNRAQCPDCRARGREVERVRRSVTITV